MLFQDPLAQPALVFVQRQVPVFGFFANGHAAAECRFGIDQVVGAERSSALLALGFLLFVATFIVLLISRLMLRRLSQKEGGR